MFGIDITIIIAIILSILLFISCGITIATVYYSITFGLQLIRVQEAIEDSLDIMDERYGSISKILEIPLFHDSPEIRRVLQDVGDCRNAILLVANLLGTIEEQEEN